jgi:uncharacterized membrane protein
MSDGIKKKKTHTLDLSNKQFEKLLTVCLLIGIIVVGVFVIYYVLTPEEGFVVFGILNEDQEAENYQTNAIVGENISFFMTVENYLGRDFTFKIKVLKGDNNTVLNATGGNGVLNFTSNEETLIHGEKWISDNSTISFWEVGENRIIIFELWEVLQPSDRIYDILWLRLNITTP